MTGRLDLAAAVLAVIDHDACVLTSDGEAYRDGGVPTIVFPS